MGLEIFSAIFQVILWSITFILAIVWIFGVSSFNCEPYTVALGLISSANSVLLKKYSDALKAEKFSTANALAYGYINNFIEPLITKLIKDNQDSSKTPTLYVYIPSSLSELYPKSIDRIKAKFREKQMFNKTVSIKLDEGRGIRDIITIKNLNDKQFYFDFPNTLLTLLSMIEFKLNSPRNDFNEKEKNKLAEIYISAFVTTAKQLLSEKKLMNNVRFVDSSLDFEEY